MDISNWPELLSLRDAMKILGYSRTTLWRKRPLMERHGVKFLTMFNDELKIKIDRDSLFEFIDKRMLELLDQDAME